MFLFYSISINVYFRALHSTIEYYYINMVLYKSINIYSLQLHFKFKPPCKYAAVARLSRNRGEEVTGKDEGLQWGALLI